MLIVEEQYSMLDDLKDMSDEDVLSLSIKNPDAFEELLNRYQGAFLRKAQSVLHSKEDSEEIVQEAFVKIYMNASKFTVQEGASFKSWGYKILLNTAFTRYQKLKKQRAAEATLEPDFYEVLPDTQTRQYEKYEVSDYLVSVFSKMPDHLSRALRLHFVEGHSQKEVAEIEGVSVGAIKTRIHRAKKEFKNISNEPLM